MLRAIISPAKKMLSGSESFSVRDVPALSARAQRLLDELSAMDDAALQRLWGVSDRLLPSCLDALAALRAHGIPLASADLADPAYSGRVSPAVFAYVGIQYQSMAPSVMDEAALAWLQAHLHIVSGLYGCLRPFDAVLPYRLEMGARIPVDGARDLYGFWGDAIARAVCRGGNAGEDGDANMDSVPDDPTVDPAVHVVNLASVEYAKAVLPHLRALGIPCTTCIFGEDVRAGRPVQRSTASKTARGSMVRWMAEHGIDDPADLPAFDIGHRFSPTLSGDGTLVFLKEGVSA